MRQILITHGVLGLLGWLGRDNTLFRIVTIFRVVSIFRVSDELLFESILGGIEVGIVVAVDELQQYLTHRNVR